MNEHETFNHLADLPNIWGDEIADAGFSARVQARVDQWRARRHRILMIAGSVAALVSGYQLTQLSASAPVIAVSESFLSPLAILTTPSMLLALLIATTACGVACLIPGRV